MEVHSLRLQEGKKRWWVLFDKVNTMSGRVDESLDGLVARWKTKHGPPSKRVRHQGYHSKAEAAATITDHQLD